MSLMTYYKSSIGKKQIVAITGLMLIIYLVLHLAGNLLIYGGPEALNKYAETLASLRPGFYLIEVALALVFLIHIWVTTILVTENWQARKARYADYDPKGKRTWSSRLMPISGLIIITFVIVHLLDFTFVNHEGANSILGDGKGYKLYGILINTFADPFRSLLYVTAMFCIALHLSHGVQSFIQTFGFNHPRYTPIVQKFSNWFALLMAIGFSSIPVYVYFLNNSLAFR